jgi:F-type H+/Na+-transporting ATPase subunit beta
VFTGIGEEVKWRNIHKEMTEKGLIKKCALVYAQTSEPVGARIRSVFAGLTMAEHFRDAQKKDIFLFIDNLFHLFQVWTYFNYNFTP